MPRLTVFLPGVFPTLLPNLRELAWDSFGQKVLIQTDNQDVEQIFAGLYYLKVPELRPLGVRIARLVARLWSGVFKPKAALRLSETFWGGLPSGSERDA